MSTRSPKPSIKSLALEYLESQKPAAIGEQELAAIDRYVRAQLGRTKPLSRGYLLALLNETQVEISRSLGGLPVDLRRRVHFGSPERAAVALVEMQQEYSKARVAGDKQRAEDCRRAVRQAKDRLRQLLRRPRLSADKRTEKEELLRWFLIWLETPELFDRWLALRRGENAARQ